MKEYFKFLDEIFNLPVQDYSSLDTLKEGVDYIRIEIPSSRSKKSSSKIKKKSKILKIKRKDTKEIVYESQNSSYGLKNYYGLVDDLISGLLKEQKELLKPDEEVVPGKSEKVKQIRKPLVVVEYIPEPINKNKEQLYCKINLLIKEPQSKNRSDNIKLKQQQNNDYYYNILKKERLNVTKFKDFRF